MSRLAHVTATHDRWHPDEDSQTARAFIGLRKMILQGEFCRGERISELPLVARLGTSRTRSREGYHRCGSSSPTLTAHSMRCSCLSLSGPIGW